MNQSDLIALAHRLPLLEYSAQAWLKIQAQFPGAVGKDAADHVVDSIAALRAENAKLRACIAAALEAYNDADMQGVERRLNCGLEQH